MSIPVKDEKRALSAEEAEVIAKTHLPALEGLSDKELKDTIDRLRNFRERARTISRQQRREMRGKASARGRAPAAENAGSELKKSILSQGLKRLNKERSRREAASARAEMRASMEQALAGRRARQASKSRPSSKTARTGAAKATNPKRTVKADPREVGRVSQANKLAQARRDSK